MGLAPYPVAVSDSPLELCRRYRDAFFACDVEAILALVTPDFVFENVTAGGRVEGIGPAEHAPPVSARAEAASPPAP